MHRYLETVLGPTSVRGVKLERNSPKGSVRFGQFEASIPGLMVAPHNQGFGLSTGFGVDQSDLLTQGQRGTHDGHAAGMAHIHRDGIGVLFLLVVVPLDHELYARDDALMGAHARPTIFEAVLLVWLVWSDCHRRTSLRIDFDRGGAHSKVVPGRCQVNGTFSKKLSRAGGGTMEGGMLIRSVLGDNQTIQSRSRGRVEGLNEDVKEMVTN
jgi:hypothetical protein